MYLHCIICYSVLSSLKAISCLSHPLFFPMSGICNLIFLWYIFIFFWHPLSISICRSFKFSISKWISFWTIYWYEGTRPNQGTSIFKKLSFSLLIFFDENVITKLVGDTLGNCFRRVYQLLCNWIKMHMIFKSSRSKMFYKIGVLKKSAKFRWKHLRPVTLLKRDSSTDVFLRILRNC